MNKEEIYLNIWYCNYKNIYYDGSAGKESPCNAGDTEEAGWSPGLKRSPGGGNGNPLQSSCLKKIPWTKESGGLLSKVLHRVGRD